MARRLNTYYLVFMVLTAFSLINSPAADATPLAFVEGVCIRNCAQCKKMFGDYFEGQHCATACVKFKGKYIPDCVDIESIAPFLSKY